LFGMITPSGLHFERHHQGWVDIDPTRHRLMINGLVDSPSVFTMADLLRLPSVSRIHFLECGATRALSGAMLRYRLCSTPTVCCQPLNSRGSRYRCC
jgi:sulfane dehydrogenase subunit SoxC